MNGETQRDPAIERRLVAELKGVRLGREVHAFQWVASTMDVAHELARAGASEGTVVWAERQRRGRGRLGRVWESPAGGVYCSIVLRPARLPTETPQLSLVAGLAAAETIRELTGLCPAIRWPNDLLLDGKKVCGILIEVKSGAVVVGVGINVATALCDLPETATSLAIAGADCDAYRLTGVLCRQFQKWYDSWTANGFLPIRDALRPWMGLFGQPVHMTVGSERCEGVASDLDESGRLLIRVDSGMVRPFEIGEVTRLQPHPGVPHE